MFKVLGGALLLAAGVACTRECVVPGPTSTTPDSVIVTGGDTVIVAGGDSVIVAGGDSVAFTTDATRRTVICKLQLTKNPSTTGTKLIYRLVCAPRP